MKFCSIRERTLQPAVVALLSAFVFALVLAVAPQWHEQVHADSALPGHQCAVTLIASGKIEQGSVPAPNPGLPLEHSVGKVPSFTSTWVAPLFLGAAIFEHAPPPLS